MKQYEAVVIGAGPGGYEAALELAKAGVKTLLIDRSKERIGGVCLNEGCIPTKAYLQSAEYISEASYFNTCGVELDIKGVQIDRLEEKTRSLIDEIRSGVIWMLDQAGVELLFGSARFLDAGSIEVSGERIGFEKCIVATGSRVRELPLLPLDGKRIISSREVFELGSLPASITIVGGGPIGCELATFFSAFGTEVTLIGRSAQLLPSEDEDVAKALLRAFKKRHINVLTGTSVKKAEVKEDGVKLLIEGGTQERMRAELVLCATGRTPYTEGLKLENAGIRRDEKGFVSVNASFQTAQKHIYAVGDCIDTPAFAHTAYVEARTAVRNITGGGRAVNDHITPVVTFSHPVVASCGLREKEANDQGRAIEVKKAFFKVNAKAKILGDDSGFAKMIVCAESGVILGASVVGVEAMEVIHELMLAIEKKLTAKELTEMIHVHPTVSEIIRYL